MIISLIFAANFIYIIFIFIRYYKRESASTAFSYIGLIIILFAVFWAISTFAVNLILPPEGFGKELDANTLSLILVAVLEIITFRFLFGKPDTTEDETET